ncbi:hypothetical protein GQ457_12G015630 [Hibiscus cannabinus]
MQQYCGVVLKQLRSQRLRKHQSRISAQIFPAAAEGRISRKGEIASEYSRIFLKEACISGKAELNKVNPVHVRNQKHELTPPRNRY